MIHAYLARVHAAAANAMREQAALAVRDDAAASVFTDDELQTLAHVPPRVLAALAVLCSHLPPEAAVPACGLFAQRVERRRQIDRPAVLRPCCGR